MSKTAFPAADWQNPGKKFRSAPFWSWNGKLEKEELLHQIRIFKEMGMGGFFMHSRIGLATEYMSQEWFEMIHCCIGEAEIQDMDAWLYDEDRWPSGYAGGLVTKEPENRLHLIFLTEVPYEECATFEVDREAIGLFAAVVDGINAEKVRKISTPAEVTKGETLLQFVFCADFDYSWYNDCSYLNPLKPEAVQKFIDLTHEKYFQECGSKFGGRVPGIFTDEPQYGYAVTQRDWLNETKYSTTFDMQIRDIILERYGYDITERIYELFFDVKECEFPVSRMHYIKVMTELFLKNYGKPIGDWCKKHNLCYTGHVMGEDYLARQVWNCGSPMRYYRYMDMPGIDMLSEFSSNYFIARELSSAGRQFGLKDRLAELYGCTGWEFPPAGHKAIGDWLLALGVNFRCQHLAHYTMAGEGKRDYPASIREHLPWYKEYKNVEDYFARICTILAHGTEKCDILLLSPNESAWCLICKDFLTDKRMYALDKEFADLNMQLQRDTLDFDIGDEGILAEDGKVIDGKLQVGLMAYSAVVLPRMLTMRETTWELLAEFRKAGGIVIFTDDTLPRIDGVKDERIGALQEKCREFSLATLEKFRKVKLSKNHGEIIIQSRYGDAFDMLFAVNASCVPVSTERVPGWSVPRVTERKTEFAQIDIQWQTMQEGTVYELNPENGEIYSADAEKNDGKYLIHTSFAALQSRLFIVTAEDLPVSKSIEQPAAVEYAELPQTFDYQTNNVNLLILDHFNCSLSGKAFNDQPEYVLTLDDRIRTALNIPVRKASMVQPWVETPFCGECGSVELTAEFECEYKAMNEVFLALETPEQFKIILNGIEISNQTNSYFFDNSLKKVMLPENILQYGTNKLVLQVQYNCRFSGLEAVYIGGNFGVRQHGVSGIITALPEKLIRRSWTEQGFPFYNGSITYKCWVKRNSNRQFMLKLPEFAGALCKVKCNGATVKNCMWEPYEVDLSESAAVGANNLLELEVTGSPRNMMGPFFYKAEKLRSCLPFHFKEYGSSQRKLLPMGLL